MYYRHNLDYKYPEKSDEHMITVKKVREVKLDENYPYKQKGFWWKVKRALYFVALNLIVFPLLRLTHGLKIHGKKNLKKYKKEFKNGAITISNHVFMWDYLCVQKAIRPHLSYHPAWAMNLEGPNGPFIRIAGGIPIPTGNTRCMIKFRKAIEEVLQEGKWLHFFPEGSMWYFYPDIRPLKRAVFKYAVVFDRPVIPITISFRDRKGLYKLWGNTPLADLYIGEPLFADKTLPLAQAQEKLHKQAYHTMQVMNGINPGDPTYNSDYRPEQDYQKTM